MKEMPAEPHGARKVAQLTGDLDRETGEPTTNQSGSRSGIHATDLGASFDHGGRIYFLC